ncbi:MULTISPECIES: DedA family protein [Streptomyces]|uniref:DedA family protein n=1 Tax=Streptomyces TaxID=1883 RepID=UPI001F3CC21E|nr:MULTISPECIES: DedA family protein [Streptomyces]
MNTLTHALGHVPPRGAYTIVAAALLAESVLLIGAFIPTLTLLLTAGALARTGHLHLPVLILVASCAVAAGDLLAHRTGRVLGERLRTGTLGRRLPATAWQRAEELTAHRGGQALFVARFLPVVRTLAPHLAGAARLPYRRIAPYSLAAAPLWTTVEAGTGYTATASLPHALSLGTPALAAAACIAAAALLWTKTHRKGTTGDSMQMRGATSRARAAGGAGGAGAGRPGPGTAVEAGPARRGGAGRRGVQAGPDRVPGYSEDEYQDEPGEVQPAGNRRQGAHSVSPGR